MPVPKTDALPLGYTPYGLLKGWLREPTVTKVTGPMRPFPGNRKVARFPGNDVPFVGLLITN